MSRGPRLLPNLGAEEGGDWRRALAEPRVAAAARLWRCLFGEHATIAEPDASGIPWLPPPPALGPSCRVAAFEWLEQPDRTFAWLADAGARADADAAGVALDGPSAEVVARVHDKAFAWRAAEAAGLVPRPLRGAQRIFEPDELEDPRAVEEAIAAAASSWPDWTEGRFALKPRIGTSGRGRVDGRAGALDGPALARALPRLARQGGAVLEPWLERVADLSAQVRVGDDAGVLLLGSLQLLCSAGGSYRGHRGEVDSRGRVFSGLDQDEAMREAAAAVALEARAEGFTGVAGLDGLVFREPSRPAGRLRPCVEWNARFTMGIVVVGLVRRLLPRLREELGLRPGERRAFGFALDAPPGGWARLADAGGDGSLFAPLFLAGDEIEPALLFPGDPGCLEALG